MSSGLETLFISSLTSSGFTIGAVGSIGRLLLAEPTAAESGYTSFLTFPKSRRSLLGRSGRGARNVHRPPRRARVWLRRRNRSGHLGGHRSHHRHVGASHSPRLRALCASRALPLAQPVRV